MKRIALTAEQGSALIRSAGTAIYDVPLSVWGTINEFRQQQTFAVVGSANFNDLKMLHAIVAVAGFDQLVAENKQKPNEPEGNAYHWVMAQTRHPTHPYLLYGPFYDELKPGHWFELEKLDAYRFE